MKSIFSSAGPLAAAFAIAALAGCAATQDAQHHPAAPAAQAPATMGPGAMSSGPSGNEAGMMDMKTMCDMHEKIMSARTPEERSAMMGAWMQNMSPEMQQRHLQMMQEQCRR